MTASVVHHLPANGLPPRVRLTWDAPGSPLGSSFGGWRIRRQIRGTPPQPLVDIGFLGVRDGYSAATVESEHTEFFDYEAPWTKATADAPDGVRYVVSAVHAVTGIESLVADGDVAVDEIAPTWDSWLCSNAAPWLNTPLYVENGRSADTTARLTAGEAQGRDHWLVRVRRGIPGETYRVQWMEAGYPPERLLAGPRAASISGRVLSLLDCRGDQHYGILGGINLAGGAGLAASADFLCTAGPDLADFNGPAGVRFDGTADYATTDDEALLDPGSGEFTFFLMATFSSTTGRTHIAKRVAGDGWTLLQNGANVEAIFDGTSTSTMTDALPSTTEPVVYIATTTGAAQALYRARAGEFTTADTDNTSHGAVSNSEALRVGARSDASAFAADLAHAWGCYSRALSSSEAQELARYLLGYARARAPHDASMFIDLRDSRCWSGLGADAVDLAGEAVPRHNVTFVSSPTPHGYPWPLAELTAWRDR